MPELRVFGPGGPRCCISVDDSATLADVRTAIEAETGIRPVEQSLFHGLDELLCDEGIAKFASAEPAEILLVHCPGVEHHVSALLNHASPGNSDAIMAQLAKIDVTSPQEMDVVIRSIVGKALADKNTCQTFAGMASYLCDKYPTFPSQAPEKRRISFKRELVARLQAEYESGLASIGSTLKRRVRIDQVASDRMVATMRLIGNLFVGQVVPMKVIETVVPELIGIKESGLPQEHEVELACELLTVAGMELDAQEHGRDLVYSWIALLSVLKQRTWVYSKSLQLRMQEVIDLKASGWSDRLAQDRARLR